MNFANPYLFDAILDGIPHRFVLVQECEFLQGNDGFSPPRFSVGAVNATRDPRYSAIRQLMEVGVSDSALQIPPSWLMAHQYIYILHEYTDEYGWQYRSQWSALGPPGPKDEPWTREPTATSRVRRRIWLTTIVPKYELVRAKRLLAENLKIDYGNVKLQGELYRYEKGTLNRSWNKRRFILYHNRIEIYTSSTKKTEVLLQDCEVKMLPDGQIAGAKNVFVVRNLAGTVNLLLSAEDQNIRREWVFAIQYQLAMNSPDVNFVPLEYSPPTGDYPDNRVLVAGDLKLQSPDGQAYDRSFHLLPREVVYYDGDDLRGRIFVEKATVAAEDRNLNFSVTSQSGITLNLAADTPEQKNLWMLSVRKQVQHIDAYNTMKRNLPREEHDDLGQPAVDRISQFYDGNWSAPPVAGEDEEYIRRIFTAPYENHPDHFEFSEELGIRLDKKPKPEASTFKVDVQTRAHTTELIKPSINKYKTMQIVTEDLADIKEMAIPTPKLDKAPEIHNPSLSKIKELVLPERKDIKDDSASPASIPTPPTMTPTLPQPTRSLARLKSTMSMLNMSGAVKHLNVKRILINPRFMLAALKGITHRFVLVLESENRINAPRDIQDAAPLRFTVGGSRASKDPRMVRFDQLIGISNKNPEVQLPAGWFMLHQYVNIIQSNTDDYGWQYRSTWSEGTLNATDEQWVDMVDEQKQVRRRLWMTTVVKRDDFIKAKKMIAEELMKAPDDYILKEDLYLHDPEKGSSATSWQRRNVILYHNKVEFYSGNEKVNDVSLIDCEVKVLSGPEAGGRSFPFCIYHPNGSITVKLDATDKDMRLRWMRALLYQLAIITPEANFAPFVFGPPTGELPEARIILCGDLEVLDNATNVWDLHQIQMQEQALLVLHRDGHLHGRLLLDHAVVKAREDECEFTVKTQDGLVVHFRALNPDTKFSWVRILKRQIHFAEYAHGRKSHDESSVRQVVKHYQDSDWIGREGEYGEDDSHMRTLRQNFKATLMSTWSGERGSETPTASSLVTEQWRITQQNAAMKLNATSVSSDITQVDVKNIPIPPNLLSKFGKTKSPTSSSVRITELPSDDSEVVASPLRNQSLRLTNGGGVSVTASGGATPLSPAIDGGNSSAIVSEPSSTKSAAFAASEPSSMKSSGIAGVAGSVGVVSEPVSVKVTTTVMPTVETTTVHHVAVASEPLAVKSAPEAVAEGPASVAGSSTAATKVESASAPLSASKVATGGLSSVQGLFPAVGSIGTQESEPYAPPPAYEAAGTLSSPQAKAASSVPAPAVTPSRASSVPSAAATTPVAGASSSKIVITRSATGSKPIGADSASQKAPEFTTITLRGVAGAQASPQDKASEDAAKQDKGEDFEEAARAIAQLAESNNKESHGAAQQKLRTLNQMTMAYMRRLGYVEGLSPTHACVPMNHLNDFDQAYVLENGFFKDGEDTATHAYIPLEALRRSLMSLEGGAAAGVDIKKVTLRHVPTNLLIRRGIDKPSEPESELLREARRRATTRRVNIDDAEGAGSGPNNDSEEPEFLREARRRQQSRRVSVAEESADLTPSSKGDEAEPEFLREAKRRQASRRLSLESDANAARDEATGEVENEAVREARRREQRRREMEEEAARKAREEAEARRHVEDEARRRAEQEEAARQAEKAARIAALEAEVARKKALDEAAKKQADEEALRKIAEEKARKLLEVGVIEVNTTHVPMQVDVDRPSMGEYDQSFMSPNTQSLRTPSNDDANDYLSPAGRTRLPPSGPSSANHRRNSAISLSNPASFDLEDELSQMSKRLRPVAADDMSVGSYQRDDASISSQKRRAVRLKNMSTEYLQRKGYLLPGNDFATIPLTDLRSSDQKLVTENGFLDEDGTNAIIPLKNTDTRPAQESAESGKLTEQISLKPVARDGLPPPRPGLQREDSSILKSVQLRPVDRRNADDRANQRAPDSTVSPLVQVKQKLRRVSDLRARNVRSNSIMGKIQKFEKTNSVPSTPTGSSGGFGSSTSEVRGISRSTSIAAKRNSEPAVPPSPSAASGSGSASKPPAGRPTSGNLSASKPPSGSSSPRAGDKAAATPDRAGVSVAAGSGSASPPASPASTPTSASTGEVKPRGTTVTIAAASTKPPNPLLQRKKSMTDKGLGAPKKSFRF
eukprot:gene7177-5168_t